MKAVIMAGGKGTRLASVATDMPKPMVPVAGKPVLEHQIESLVHSGFYDITMIVGHLGEKIKAYFGNGSKWSAHISYITEELPLGTAGALTLLENDLQQPFLLLFGDIMLDMDFNRFMYYHQSKNSSATLFVHPNSHPFDSDLVRINTQGKIIYWDSKHNERDYDYHNLVNAGVYILSSEIFKYIKRDKKNDLEKDVIIPMINDNKAVFAYCSTEYTKDMGTPERLDSVTVDYETGVCSARNLKQPQRCIFLDRDGTINKLSGFINNPDQLQLIDGAAEAIAKINKSQFLCCVITNQPVIARGECSFEGMEKIHNRMETLLGKQGAYLDGIYYCPHHPHKGYKGEIPELKFDCDCRKPKIGMLEQAAQDLHIDLKRSYFIGDTTMDVKTAENAGMKAILVRTGEGGTDGKHVIKSFLIYDNILQAVDAILEGV